MSGTVPGFKREAHGERCRYCDRPAERGGSQDWLTKLPAPRCPIPGGPGELFVAQRDQRVYLGGAAGGEVSGGAGYDEHHGERGGDGERVGGLQAEQLALDEASAGKAGGARRRRGR